MPVLLAVTDLCVRYGPIDAVRGVTLSVGHGEIVTLLGANGAGKSTTLNAMVGLVPVAEGDIAFSGSSVRGLPTEQIVAAGMTLTPEGRRVFAGLTVEENLLLGGFSRRHAPSMRSSDLDRVFALFPILAERRRQLAGTLSGGQQQQLAIGRSLMSSPKLLLLDEPSLGLAPRIIDLIFEHILALRNAGVTILLVEQNAAMALDVADRGYVMRSGKIVISGTREELLSSHLVTQAYLSSGTER